MKKLRTLFYKNASGTEPVRDFLIQLNKDDKKIIGEDIKKIEYGWPIGMPVCKPLGEGLYEVRSNISSKRIVRIIFCIIGSEMILLHGFIKKTQAIEKKDIDLARNRKREVLNG
jgi:phage-related protein